MSEQSMITRREFSTATGGLAALGLFGLSASVSAARSSDLDPAFFNWRAREASKVWARGYRGRPDRTVALTDTGIDARHPDLGPWNGVRATVRDGELVLPKSERERVPVDGVGESFSGTIGPGTFATPARATHEMSGDGVKDRQQVSPIH